MKKRKSITRGEKMLYVGGIMCFILSMVIKIFFGASIGNFKMNNEKIKYKIKNEEKAVESLTMQVNELTSFDNVQKVVRDLGLAFNNDKIVVIGK